MFKLSEEKEKSEREDLTKVIENLKKQGKVVQGDGKI